MEKFEARVIGKYDSQALSDATGLKCKDPSRASQEFKDEVDINTIARRFGLTGEMPQNVPMVMQGDFTEVMDFRQAHDLLVRARESFQAMPADVRAEFDNDAARFVDFCSDERNFDRAFALGLVRPEVQAERARKAEEAFQAKVEAAAAVQAQRRSQSVVEAPKGAQDQSST